MSTTAYRVIADTATRASDDPASADYERWIDFPAGATVTDWPAHAPIEEWVASGHWTPAPHRRRDSEEAA